MQSLNAWNYGAAALHLGATIYAYNKLSSDKNRTVQMIRLKYDDEQTQTSRIDIPVTIENESKIDLKFIIVGFFAITSFAHFCYATDFFGRGWYSKSVLGVGWNPFRWVEYSLSAGLMIYLISIVSGTKDQVSAVAAALITPGLMINGFTTEKEIHQNDLHKWSLNPRQVKKPDIDHLIVLSNFIPGWFLYGVHWYIILSNYAKIAKEAKEAGKPIDASVTFMVYSQLAFFSLFGVIQTYQVYRWFTSRAGREEPAFIGYEKVYIALSAITKLVLAATVIYAMRN